MLSVAYSVTEIQMQMSIWALNSLTSFCWVYSSSNCPRTYLFLVFLCFLKKNGTWLYQLTEITFVLCSAFNFLANYFIKTDSNLLILNRFCRLFSFQLCFFIHMHFQVDFEDNHRHFKLYCFADQPKFTFTSNVDESTLQILIYHFAFKTAGKFICSRN